LADEESPWSCVGAANDRLGVVAFLDRVNSWGILWPLGVTALCAWLFVESYRYTIDWPVISKWIARMAGLFYLVGFGIAVYVIGMFCVAALTGGVSYNKEPW
jgi:hypothetical protein